MSDSPPDLNEGRAAELTAQYKASFAWMRNNPTLKRAMAASICVLVLFEALLLITGTRVLIGERHGERYTDYSPYMPVEKLAETISCTYFTGRSVKTVSGDLPDASFECPFLYRP